MLFRKVIHRDIKSLNVLVNSYAILFSLAAELAVDISATVME